MNVSVGDHWQRFVEEAVRSGRYGSASEVVREGLRLVEERETKLLHLRDVLTRAIAEGGTNSEDDLGAALDDEAEVLASEGY